MKKIIIWSIAIVLLISCTVLGIGYKDDLAYWSTSMRRIKIDQSRTTQSIMTFNVRCITDADKDEFSWKHRANLICDLLQEYTPSIIG